MTTKNNNKNNDISIIEADTTSNFDKINKVDKTSNNRFDTTSNNKFDTNKIYSKIN
jgi:hypothetical protein